MEGSSAFQVIISPIGIQTGMMWQNFCVRLTVSDVLLWLVLKTLYGIFEFFIVKSKYLFPYKTLPANDWNVPDSGEIAAQRPTGFLCFKIIAKKLV